MNRHRPDRRPGDARRSDRRPFSVRPRRAAVLAAFASLALGAGACSSDRPASAAPAPSSAPAVTLETRPVALTAEPGYLEAVGHVKNLQESLVASKAMGKVTEVAVKAGDTVEKGEVLIRIDDRDARAGVDRAKGALAQARAARRIAKRMLHRYEKLTLSQSAAEAKHDQALYEYRRALGAVAQARGAVERAESYLSETVVTAPFAGRVVDTLIDEGEMAAPGHPLLRLEGDGRLEFEATVNGQEVDLVAVGQEVTVVLDATRGERPELAGTVTEVVPTSDPVTHSNLVRIRLHQCDGVRAGAFGRVRFARQQAACAGVLVDADRVVRHGQLAGVYVVDADRRVRLRLVRAGRTVDGRTEVLSGLRAGDEIVTSATDGLVDGERAAVATAAAPAASDRLAAAPATTGDHFRTAAEARSVAPPTRTEGDDR